MNAPSNSESAALVAATSYPVGSPTDAASLILGPGFDRVQSFAALMCKGAVSVPQHLRGNMGDCMAITIQALGWKMNPFAVAQKTHVSQSGALGYEAQLVSAVLVSTGAIQREPDYEPIGDWSKVLGKVEERKSDKGGKYYVATYTKADEAGLGVIVRATLTGESKPRELPVMMSQAFPRFSTQWATDPFQQLCYLAVRKWGRLHSPGAILGVYTPDELDGGLAPGEKFMGPADVVGSPSPAPAPVAPSEWPADLFAARLPEWHKAIRDKKATPDAIVAKAKTKYPLTSEQEAQIRATPKADTTGATDAEPKVSFAQVADAIAKAADLDALALAGDLIKSVGDEQQRTELQAKYDARETELKN
jgi:hypothetical protein